MNRKRIKFPGAIYHIMNRGILGLPIFEDKIMKKYFVKILKRYVEVYNISLYAYVIMPNHYHLLLKDNDEKISDFMKALNSMYASMYRTHREGKGYVFQNRYKGVIVSSGVQLVNTFLYIMANPHRAGLTENSKIYPWTSMKSYFAKNRSTFICSEMIEEVFITKRGLIEALKETYNIKVNEIGTKWGSIAGNKAYVEEVFRLANKRGKNKGSKIERRSNEHKGIEILVKEFENIFSVNVDLNSLEILDLEIRDTLLVFLHDNGLTYSQIILLKPFVSLKVTSLSTLYRRKKVQLLHEMSYVLHRPS